MNQSLFLLLTLCYLGGFSHGQGFSSAFGAGNSGTNYTLELIKEFTPASQDDEIKCRKIPGLGFPVKAISKFNQQLSELFNPSQNNTFVKMFFYKDEIVDKNRIYKYGIEIRSFIMTRYIALKLVMGGNGSSDLPEEMFLLTSNPQLLPTVLEDNNIDLGSAYGCGDLKNLFQTAQGA